MPAASALRKFATSFSDEPRGPLSSEVQQLGEFLHVPVGEIAKFHSSEKPLIVFVASGAVKLSGMGEGHRTRRDRTCKPGRADLRPALSGSYRKDSAGKPDRAKRQPSA